MNRKIENIRVKQHALGIVPDKPRRAYDAVEYLNPSSIAAGIVDHLEIDPAAIKWAFENPSNGHAAAAQDRMDRGTLVHIMLLQPERLCGGVAKWPANKNRTTSKPNEKTGERKLTEWEEFQLANLGKLIVRDVDYEAVSAAVKAFRFNPQLCEMLNDLDAEVAIFTQERGIYCKGLVDAITRGPMPCILDLKTTEAGFSRRAIETTIRNFRYREKMAAYRRWYCRETDQDPELVKCHLVWLNMVEPYGIRLQQFTTSALEFGERRIDAAIDEVERCLDADSWPMFASSADMVMVSEWEIDNEPLEGFDDE